MARKKEPEQEDAVISGTVDDFMNSVMNNPVLAAQMEALGFKSKNPGGMTFKEVMICSQIANAVKGDTRAYKAIMEHSESDNRLPLERFVDGEICDSMHVYE